MKRYFVIAFIVAFAGFIRFYQLAFVPPALNSDEVAIGYNAYSILKTGRDEYNKLFPFTFRSFDDYKMPVYVYLVAGAMRLFGFNDFAVRFPSALFGTLSVLFVYLLVREMSKEKDARYATVSAFFLAVSPWSVMFSRSGYEANVAVCFNIVGTYLLLISLRKSWFLLLSAVFFSLSIWTYHTCRIFVPLLLFGFFLVYWRQLLQKKISLILAIILGSILLFPVIRMTFSLEGQMRAIGVSAFANPDTIKKGIVWTTQDQVFDQSVFSVFHNRRVEYLQTFLRGYFAHFDLNYLFLDKSIDKYRAPGVGLLYLFELPLLFIGAYQLVKKRVRGSALIFWWLLSAPVAAAFTLQLPHPVRTLVFLPVFQIIAAIGLVELFGMLKRYRSFLYYLLFIVISAFMVSNIVYFFHQYFTHMPIDNAQYWYTGRKEMVAKLKTIESQYDKIIISNKLDFPYIFFLYYWPIEPSVYQRTGGTVSGGFLEEGNRFGKYEFRTINISQRLVKEKVLFVGMPGEEFKEKFVVDRIYYPDSTSAIVFFQ